MALRINTILLIIALIISIFTTSKKSEPYLRYFPLFLLTTTLTELSASWLSIQHKNNTLLYNLYSIFEFGYLLNLFFQLLEKPRVREIIKWISITLPAICLIDIFFILGPTKFHTYTFILGAIIMDILGILYLIQIFNSPKEYNLLRTPSFWLVISIIFFYITTPSFLGVLNYVSSLPRHNTIQLTYLLVMVDSLYYLLIIVALLCQINFRKYIYSS